MGSAERGQATIDDEPWIDDEEDDEGEEDVATTSPEAFYANAAPQQPLSTRSNRQVLYAMTLGAIIAVQDCPDDNKDASQFISMLRRQARERGWRDLPEDDYEQAIAAAIRLRTALGLPEA